MRHTTSIDGIAVYLLGLMLLMFALAAANCSGELSDCELESVKDVYKNKDQREIKNGIFKN